MTVRRLIIASDHAGYRLKTALLTKGLDAEDLGCFDTSPTDYPKWAHALCRRVKETERPGVLICGSGIGMSIAANRHSGIRAALVYSLETSKLAKEHNNANVLCLGARLVDESLAAQMIQTWMEARFDERHRSRIEGIEQQI